MTAASIKDMFAERGYEILDCGDKHYLGSIFTPQGVILHHTASARYTRAGDLQIANSQGVVATTGNSGAPAPLCNILTGRDNVNRWITDGRANHAGIGNKAVLQRVMAGVPPEGDEKHLPAGVSMNGNPFFYGIEIENNGLDEPWDFQLVTAAATAAAILCWHHGWGPERVISHREWTRRKIDPNWADGARWRDVVRSILDGWRKPAVQVAAGPVNTMAAEASSYVPLNGEPPMDFIVNDDNGGEMSVVSPQGKGKPIPSGRYDLVQKLRDTDKIVVPGREIHVSGAEADAIPNAF